MKNLHISDPFFYTWWLRICSLLLFYLTAYFIIFCRTCPTEGIKWLGHKIQEDNSYILKVKGKATNAVSLKRFLHLSPAYIKFSYSDNTNKIFRAIETKRQATKHHQQKEINNQTTTKKLKLGI